MTIARLHDAMSEEGEALARAARAVGGSIDFDPRTALSRDMRLEPPGLWSPNRQCRMVEAKDGWIAVNLARIEDREAVPAWLGEAAEGTAWEAVESGVREQPASALIDQAVLLGMPVAGVCERNGVLVYPPLSLSRRAELVEAPSSSDGKFPAKERPFDKLRAADFNSKTLREPPPLRVLDLSALWAGPSCGGLLAEAGLAVTKIESPCRPDPTPLSTPELDRRINGRKRRVSLDLAGPEVQTLLAKASILITSARPHALARLGFREDTVFERNPGLIWVAITAHGWRGQSAMRVGFGDDCAAAGGLVEWSDGAPQFIGDALADPLTGLRAARLALEALASGRSGLIDVALAPTAACFAAAMV